LPRLLSDVTGIWPKGPVYRVNLTTDERGNSTSLYETERAALGLAPRESITPRTRGNDLNSPCQSIILVVYEREIESETLYASYFRSGSTIRI
jgi:hypothetical protein